MKRYLYLSLIPESLIVSMLPPEDFGSYFAIGSKKRSRGQAIFFEVDPDFTSDFFPFDQVESRCVPHPDGRPKRSLYLGVYRVLEHIPLDALRNLYLATDDGRVLALEKKAFKPDPDAVLHLYQEFCPVTVRVASRLNPEEFTSFITGPKANISVPKIVFCDMILRGLRRDADSDDIDELPYKNIGHLRDCMRELSIGGEKKTKTVIRHMQQEVLYRTIRTGFFVGDNSGMLHYPMPSLDQLDREYYEWWRSAQMTFGE